MAIIIRSGATTDEQTIDATSKAARVTPYDSAGGYRGIKKTYCASSEAFVAAVTADVPWFLIEGSATKTLTVTRMCVSGMSLTAIAYLVVAVAKHSTAASGGTATTLTQVPLDSNDAAGTAGIVKAYTAAPTAGALVGFVAAKRSLAQATTAAAAGVTEQIEFNFGALEGAHGVVLRGTAQGLSLQWPVAPATAVTLAAYVEWTEE